MNIYFTLTGTQYRYGHEFLKQGMLLNLVKEPENKVDHEAIRVELAGLGIIGYVASSYRSLVGESYSAGRLYDKIGDTAVGKVLYPLPHAVLCELVQEEPKMPEDANEG